MSLTLNMVHLCIKYNMFYIFFSSFWTWNVNRQLSKIRLHVTTATNVFQDCKIETASTIIPIHVIIAKVIPKADLTLVKGNHFVINFVLKIKYKIKVFNSK